MKKTVIVFTLIGLFSWAGLEPASTVYAASLIEAQKDYLYGRYDDALAKAQGLAETDDVLYFLGLAYAKVGNYRRGRVYLRKLIRCHPNSQFYGSGLIKLADTYFMEKNYQQAEELYQEIKSSYPSLNNISLVYLRLAQIATRQGLWSVQKEYIKLIKEKYPKSPELKLAEFLQGQGEFFTIQVGAFSSKKNALSLEEELSQNYKPYIVEEKGNGYSVYKVRVGRFKKRYDVQKVASRLINQGYPTRIYP